MLLALGKILNTIVELRDKAGVGELVTLDAASAAVEELRKLYVREHRARVAMYEASGFDINKVEERNPA